MGIEVRMVRRHVTPRYKELRGKQAIEEFALDLLFEIIYASKPKQRGPKPLSKIKDLIKQARLGDIGNTKNLEELYYEVCVVVRDKKRTVDIEFIKNYLHLS